ncbi:FKBP-type peptidyl-prolyl cis-trans isomerase [Flagellimonas sp. GZD32]|uniref:FKBP-type peptidyl-prolyl cis-trans isomerase n=1 Tax=Flagellimonas cixiensis TaxID=3228750 RepID=UPI0035C8C6F7
MKYRLIVLLVFGIIFFSCKKDDDEIITVPPSLLGDVAPEDDEKIKEFLNTHFYNYEDFDVVTMPEGFDYKIVIDTIAGENADKTPMMEFAEAITLNVSNTHLGLSAEEENIPHTYYFIDVLSGAGGSPTYADSTLVRYQGSSLDGTLFDESQDFLWQELPSTYRGYGDGISRMNAGTEQNIVDNPDGSYEITDRGIAIIVMPSGLAAFNRPVGAAGTYAPVLFKVELGLFVENTDSDNDGIPSIQEDLNNNRFLLDDNTDADTEPRTVPATPNFRDADDDGDGVSTRSEITDENGNIIFPYPDSNGDGIPDYLDPDVF